jgi:catechol 2,3-dioxygenase-like lactoylglutathione lyase family enzyme
MVNVQILQNHYVLAVHDVRLSANFYTDVLGFDEVAEHDGWIFVQKDQCMIMLGECPDDAHPSSLGSHNYFAYLCVNDADAYYQQLQAKQVDLLSTIEDKPWGMREFGISTVDGHRIMIGQELALTDDGLA